MSSPDKPPLRTPVLWQSIAYFYSNFDATNQGWITGTDRSLHNQFFRTEWVVCTYPTSGNYCRTPRIIYYALVLLSLRVRTKSWGIAVGIVTVMVYSSTAAIHAIVAAVAALRQLTTQLSAMKANYEVVLVDGPSQTGWLEQGSPGGPVWLPIFPMVYEPDADALLAIVGVAFICLLPMQIRSRTLRNATPEQRSLVLAWSLLLWMGLVSAFTIDIFATIWFFPQLRFCPPNQADPIPTSSNGPSAGVENWNGKDWYRWNRTIRDHFIFNNSTALFPNNCIYPCSDFTWPLRDPTDIIMDQYSLSSQRPISQKFVVALYIAACVAVGLFTGANLTVYFMTHSSTNLSKDGFGDAREKLSQAWKLKDCGNLSTYWRLIVRSWILIIVAFANWPSIITCIFFIGVKEYSMWWGGPNEETFRHVGQWGVVVGTVLLFAAVWTGKEDKREHSNQALSLKIQSAIGAW
jgi:hypothetical protein